MQRSTGLRNPQEGQVLTVSKAPVRKTAISAPALAHTVRNGHIHEISSTYRVRLWAQRDALSDDVGQPTSSKPVTSFGQTVPSTGARFNQVDRVGGLESSKRRLVGQSRLWAERHDLAGSPRSSHPTSVSGLFDDDLVVTFASPPSKGLHSKHSFPGTGGSARRPPMSNSVATRPIASGDRLKAISVHSTEDEDGIIDLTNSPPPRPRGIKRSSTPPPGGFDRFFIPPPGLPPRRKVTQKQVIAFVQVPQLKQGKRRRQYKRLSTPIQPPPPRLKSHPSPPKHQRDLPLQPGVRVHNDIAAALASVFQDNDKGKPLAGSSKPIKSEFPLPHRLPKRKKVEDAESPPAKKSCSKVERPLIDVTTLLPPPLSPLLPPPPPCYLYDPVEDNLRLLVTFPNIPTDGFDVWFNTRPLLPDNLDEDAILSLGVFGGNNFDSELHSPWFVRSNTPPKGEGDYSVGGWTYDDFDDEDLGEEQDSDAETFRAPTISLVEESTRTPLPRPPRVDLNQMRRQKSSAKKARAAHSVEHPQFDNTAPSQKALGKRRADPSLSDLGSSPYHPNDNDLMDAYLRTRPLSPMSSIAGPSHSLSPSIFRNSQSSAILNSMNSTAYFQSNHGITSHLEDDILSEDRSQFLTTNNAPSNSHLDDITSAYSMTTLDPWSSAHREYAFDTINPTLLQQPDDFVVDASYDALVTGFEEDDWSPMVMDFPEKDRDSGFFEPPRPPPQTAGVSDPLSPVSSLSSLSASPYNARKTPPGKEMGGPAKPGNDSPSRKVAPKAGIASSSQRLFNLGDSNDDEWDGSQFLGVGKRKRKRTKRALALEYDEDDVDVKVPARTRIVQSKPATTITKPPPVKVERAVVRLGPPKSFQWERGGPEGYCHQCRRKSDKLRMSCLICDKEYCNRCIAFRYPEIEFAQYFEDEDSCPKCADTCNCDICCRKRGQVFVSSKGTRAPSPLSGTTKQKQKQTSKEKPLPPGVEIVPVDLTLDKGRWGPFYGLNGAKMADAPASRGANGHYGTSFNASGGRKQQDTLRKSFIGVWHPSWGRSSRTPIVLELELDSPTFQDVENATRRKISAAKAVRSKNALTTGKGTFKGQRMYVGKEAMLRIPLAAASLNGGNVIDLARAVAGESDSDADAEGEAYDSAEEGEEVIGGYFGRLSSLTPLDSSPMRGQAAGGQGISAGAVVGVVDVDAVGVGDNGGVEGVFFNVVEDSSGGDDEDSGFSPENVAYNELARAITLSLSACGLSVEPGPPSASSGWSN